MNNTKPDNPAEFLQSKGWVRMDTAKGVCYRSPVAFTNRGIYCLEEQALEIEEYGIYEYAGDRLMEQVFIEDDQWRTEKAEEERFQATGIRLGEYPNY